MDLPPATPQNKDVPQETGGTPNPTGAHTVKVKSKTAAAVGPRENMPDRSLFARATTAMESKPMGVGGFFRVLWNYTSNYSTKSWGQARLDGIDQEELKAVIEDYLKDNPREVGKIMREITSNTESQDPRIVQAFAEALKKVNPKKFEILCKRVKNQINIVLEQGSQTSSGITQDNIKHAVDLVNQLKSVIKFSQPALALHSLARRLPADQITPDLIAFCNVFPKKAQILAKRQDFQLTSFRGTNCDDGMLLMYKDSGYDPKILDLIDAELFEGDRRDTRIESFLADPAVKSNLFWIDGIQRHSIPHITLPNGVEILSNKWCDSSEYCKSTGEPYDQAKYLKHMLDKFKDAYKSPDEAVRAFKVFVQNFTGSGNAFGGIPGRIMSQTVHKKSRETGNDDEIFLYYLPLVLNTLQNHRSQSTIRMDKDFNINLNVTACTFGKMIQQFNEKHPSTSNISPFHKNTILGVTVSSHIPAVINDTLDQRRQNGKQTTTFGIIESFGNGGSN